MKKVYFAGSIRGGRVDAKLYERLIKYIQRTDIVLTEHIGCSNLNLLEQGKKDQDIYNQDMGWLRESDVLIGECTCPSLGVGYELAYAEKCGKPCHIFYDKTKTQLSAMLTGNPYFNIHPYEEEDDIYPIIDTILHEEFNNYTLRYALDSFHKAKGDSIEERLSDIQKQFKNIAEKLFFGGHFTCNGKNIFISEVELYYQDEDEGIKDKIMFHTESNTKDSSLPYFNLGHLYVHSWGVDLTFEKEVDSFRASVLLRKFVVTDKDEKPNYESKHVITDPKKIRDYFLPTLSAFDNNNSDLCWIDELNEIKDRKLSDATYRINVPSDRLYPEKKWRYSLIYKPLSERNP